ncbi:hypothetical protein VKT23_014048 [Stygiomarasmius scandens]|uniref:Uncharacterized protein n=1 Tax=Marasmiellus scandens TaxID=2682957 RepID=A0ABR1J574_9AGAR
MKPLDNETQADWIKRVGLAELFGNAELSEKEWLVLNTSRQALSNHIHNPKRTKRQRTSRETQAESTSKKQAIGETINTNTICPTLWDLTEGVKGIFLPKESRVIEWKGSKGTTLKTCAPTILVDGVNILQEEQEHIAHIANTYGFLEGTNEHVIFLHPETPDLHSTIRFHLSQN